MLGVRETDSRQIAAFLHPHRLLPCLSRRDASQSALLHLPASVSRIALPTASPTFAASSSHPCDAARMLVASTLALLASALVARAAPSQVVFDSSAPPSELVASSSEDGFWTTFKHGRFPGHSIRARRPKFCEHVEEWSGYLDVEQEHGPTKHFYWRSSCSELGAALIGADSFESRNKPATDPVQMWLNGIVQRPDARLTWPGGPGCSSFTGMLMELGPCNVVRASNDSPVSLEYNPWSWSSNATLLLCVQTGNLH